MAIKRNIWNNVKEPLEVHEDDRGIIADMFYNEEINHIAAITSKKGSRRGDHYHKQTTQHTLVTKGSLIYLFQPADKSEPVKFEILKGESLKLSIYGSNCRDSELQVPPVTGSVTLVVIPENRPQCQFHIRNFMP